MSFLKFQLKRSSSEPLYNQVLGALKRAIETGKLSPGTRLPAERDLAKQLHSSRTTVAKAYRELETRGLLRSHVGRGTFVCAIPESAHAPFAWRGKISTSTQRTSDPAMRQLIGKTNGADVISFAAGFPAVECFPTDQFRRLTDQVLQRQSDVITRLGPAEGQPRLRQAIAQRFKVRPERVLILSGATQALDLIARCLIDPGDAIVMDRPGYVGAIQIFRAAGANLHGWDIRNADIEELEDLVLRYRPKFIYSNPTFQNPTGHTMPERERLNLLKLAVRYRIPIIEDEPYREGYLDSPPPKSLYQMDNQDVVIYLSTFAKVLAPGLRLAWIVAPEYIVDQLAMIKQRATLFTENLGQLVMAEFIRTRLYDKHLEVIRKEHRRRRDALMSALQRHIPSNLLNGAQPNGGIYFWGRLAKGIVSADLLQRAVSTGVSFANGEIFYADTRASDHLRLCFASVPTDRIEEGVKRLAVTLKRVGSNRRDRTEQNIPLI
jgi:DNA-binding transcriptional MocR family regulator